MKRIILTSSVILAFGSIAMAGGKVVEPAVVPVIPLVKHDSSGVYVSGALYYNNVYSDDYSWFDNAKDTQDELAGVTLIAGYEYNEYLAFEARASKSLFQEDYADEYHFSFFLKPQYKFRDDAYKDDYISIYALLGFGYVNVEGTDGTTPGASEIIGKTIIDDWQFQYGIGVSYTFIDEDHPHSDVGDWSIFAEYTMYMDNQSMSPTRLYEYNSDTYDELSMNGLSIGISYHF